ncbi:MAG: hypothetical protein ABJC89_00345, partial [Acidobacteriota bacterium]
GGLVFIGATNFDKKIRAFDKDTGKLLWESTMVNSANGAPATYEINGRQYIVIAAFGGKAGGPRGPAGARAGGAGAAAAPAGGGGSAGRGSATTAVDIGSGAPTGGAFVVFALPPR